MQVDIELGKAAALQRQGNFAEAIKIFQAVLKAAPKTPIAHYNLALIYKAERKFSAAEKAFKTALKLDPKYALAWQGYVQFLSERVRIKEAIKAAILSAKALNFTIESKQLIADQLALAQDVKLGNTGKEALRICLGDNGLEYEGAVFGAIDFIRSHSILSKFFNLDTDFAKLEDYFQKNSKPIVEALLDPVCTKIFSHLIIPTKNFEKGIIDLRSLLSLTCSNVSRPKILEARALIALQMELREYSAPSTKVEIRFNSDLETLAIASMYEAIPQKFVEEAHKHHSDELAKLPLLKTVCQKFEPKALVELESLSDVKNDISLRIQSQYEESPYPRWFGLRKTGSQTLTALINRLLPHLRISQLSQSPKVLVAGCGTGRHALRTAVRIKDSHVLAIDLSKSSLAYAVSKAQELAISNVEFAQADISELPEKIGKFDLIECCGVLHHMENPETAWKHLKGFLNSTGVMKIALYSSRARQDVFAAREFLKINPENVTLEDIRDARQKILNLPNEHPAKSVSNDLDFYSIGGCRDFLFNRQETCYSLPEIKVILAKLNIEFLGFEFADNSTISRYKKSFPQDPKAINLDNWDRLEEKNPLLFRGMYQFWCRPIQA